MSNKPHLSKRHGLSRRALLQAGAGTVLLSGSPGVLRAQDRSLLAIMPGVAMPDPAKAVLERRDRHPCRADSLRVADRHGRQAVRTGRHLALRFHGHQYVFRAGPDDGRQVGRRENPRLRHVENDQCRRHDRAVQETNADARRQDLHDPGVLGLRHDDLPHRQGPEEDPATKSWGLLYDDRYAGRVALRDDAYQSIMTAALALGHKEPTTMSASDLNEVKKFLISKKKNFRALWTKFGEAVNLISSGEVLGDVRLDADAAPHCCREGIPVASARPKEGLLFWSHAAFIPKDSRKADLAMEVANTMLSEEYSAALTECFQLRTDLVQGDGDVLAGRPEADRPRRDRWKDGVCSPSCGPTR